MEIGQIRPRRGGGEILSGVILAKNSHGGGRNKQHWFRLIINKLFAATTGAKFKVNAQFLKGP